MNYLNKTKIRKISEMRQVKAVLALQRRDDGAVELYLFNNLQRAISAQSRIRSDNKARDKYSNSSISEVNFSPQHERYFSSTEDVRRVKQERAEHAKILAQQAEEKKEREEYLRSKRIADQATQIDNAKEVVETYETKYALEIEREKKIAKERSAAREVADVHRRSWSQHSM